MLGGAETTAPPQGPAWRLDPWDSPIRRRGRGGFVSKRLCKEACGRSTRFNPLGLLRNVSWNNLQMGCISSTISLDMANNAPLRCDGCGQIASPEHIARRLRRLEWATRYRPVHIQALLLGAVAPHEDRDYLYSPNGGFHGEAMQLLHAVGISSAGKTAEAVHTEFQSAGLFLAHILECPVENSSNALRNSARFLDEHLPSIASRIRRSLKPKSVILVTEMPQAVVQHMLSIDLGRPILLNEGRPFALGASPQDEEVARFRAVLGSKTM